MQRLLALLILWLVAASAAGQSIRYVQDYFKAPLRTGKSTQNKIKRLLPSGTRVELLEEDPGAGYSLVRTTQGLEGWILTRYLMQERSARERLAQVEQALDKQREENQAHKRDIGAIKAHAAEIERSNKELLASNAELTKDLEDLRLTAGNALNIAEENEALKHEKEELGSKLVALERQNAQLTNRSRRDWFVAGAGVALGGLLLGLIIPRIPWRRRKRWDQF